ncbi:MAG: hypothetical protein GQ534_04320 [Candidatus Delongbacteria bacterium]|nr:hypothetical protein [Candidatus Delongbacteria bacterium]
MTELKQEMNEMMVELGIAKREYCTPEEFELFQEIESKDEELPAGVYPFRKELERLTYYRMISDLNSEEQNNLLQFRQILYLKSLKNMMVFFVVITVISMIVSTIAAIITFAN